MTSVTETDTHPGAHIADPGPLGLASFALTTFILSLANAGVIGEKGVPVVFGLTLAYGGVAQLLAGLFEFKKGNVFGATAFVSYGAFWLSFWYMETHNYGSDAKAVGWYLLAWTIFTLYMFIASLKTNPALIAVFGVLTLTFLFLALGALTGTTGLTKVGGVLGIITALVAWYTSFGGVAKSTFGKSILPLV